MTAIDPDAIEAGHKEARRAVWQRRIGRADAWFQILGLSWVTPALRAAAGENPRAQMGELWRLLGVPLVAIALFLAAWGTLAPKVQTSLGAIPGPVQVMQAAGSLVAVTLLTKGYQLTQASLASVFEYSVLGFSALFGWLVAGQATGPWGLLGLGLIAVAGSLIALRARP